MAILARTAVTVAIGASRQHHDDAIKAILSAIRELMNPPQPKRRPIGFTADLNKKS